MPSRLSAFAKYSSFNARERGLGLPQHWHTTCSNLCRQAWISRGGPIPGRRDSGSGVLLSQRGPSQAPFHFAKKPRISPAGYGAAGPRRGRAAAAFQPVIGHDVNGVRPGPVAENVQEAVLFLHGREGIRGECASGGRSAHVLSEPPPSSSEPRVSRLAENPGHAQFTKSTKPSTRPFSIRSRLSQTGSVNPARRHKSFVRTELLEASARSRQHESGSTASHRRLPTNQIVFVSGDRSHMPTEHFQSLKSSRALMAAVCM